MTDKLPDFFIRGLAAAALEPGLRRILLFDADLATMETAVSLLQQLLALTTEQTVQVVHLPGSAQEDDLWGSYTPDLTAIASNKRGGLTVAWQDGWLTQNRLNDGWLLVVLPDLTRLSLAAARACITMLDTPAVHLERHGQKSSWQPRICWLAACNSGSVGKVSPHLLDRFMLRLTALPLRSISSAASILHWLQELKPVTLFARQTKLPEVWREEVMTASSLPTTTPEAIQQIVAYSQATPHPGVRRELALGQLGRALARLAKETAVTPDYIDKAADLIGLSLPQRDEKPPVVDSPEPDPEPPEPNPESAPRTSVPETTEPAPNVTPDHSSVVETDKPEIMSERDLPPEPYPENQSPVDRELFSLQLPLRRHQAVLAERGVIIGEQPANSLQDLALIPTVLEASLYQKIRRQNQPDKSNSLILSPTDLRRYRRIPQPEKMLLLLLDYTSLRDCEWQQALIPHLRWAYVSRASITIIQVGSSHAENELRAQRLNARSLLEPHVAEALEPQPGWATPLAHGLEIACQVIQRAQQHGRALIQHTRFVIITDGRGNVPLVASHSGQVQMPVNREGIEDALQMARDLQKLKRVQKFVLNPQPQQHAELPGALADSLQGTVEIIPSVFKFTA